MAQQARRKLPPVKAPAFNHNQISISIQTELYLEALSSELDIASTPTQTDAFLDRPSTPYFVPKKTGVDVETQIPRGDLFVFDEEVKCILDVLVGKCLEQSLLEVVEEEELAALREYQVSADHFLCS